MKTLYFLSLAALLLFSTGDEHLFRPSRDISGMVAGMESICSEIIPLDRFEQTQLGIEEKLREMEKQSVYENTNPLVQTKQEYCASRPRDLLRRLCYPKGRLGHDNDGGIFGLPTGVCWWNSQFHRKVTFLTYFDPRTTSEYSDEEFRKIIININRYQVTKIDGYENFGQFLSDKKWPNRPKILQKFLQQQMGKSTLTFEWINGLKGRSNKIKNEYKKNPKYIEKQIAEIESMRESLFPENLDDSRLPVTVVQNPGVMAHAFLVYDLITIKDKFGIKAHVIYVQDSSYQDFKHTSVRRYYFDEEVGLWFRDQQYRKLQKIREAGLTPKVYTYPMEAWLKKEIREKIEAEDGVGAEDWSLWIVKDKQIKKINRGFEKHCGHPLYED